MSRRHRNVPTLLWLVVVIGLGVAVALELPSDIRRLRSDIEVGTGRSRLYRELQPARTVGLADTSIFVAAEREIPRDSTFFVVTGPRAAISDPLVLRWVRRFARYRLLPRRLVQTANEADWLLSYGGDVANPGVPVQRVVPIAPGVQLIEVGAP